MQRTSGYNAATLSGEIFASIQLVAFSKILNQTPSVLSLLPVQVKALENLLDDTTFASFSERIINDLSVHVFLHHLFVEVIERTRLNPHYVYNDNDALLFGNIVNLAETDHILIPEWDNELMVVEGRNAIISYLRYLQRISNLAVNQSPTLSRGRANGDLLLADLLRLNTSIDPITWLLNERYEELSYLITIFLLNALSPSPLEIQKSDLIAPTLYPQKALYATGFNATLASIEFHAKGSLISFETQFRTPENKELSSAVSGERFRFSWNGFEYIEDDSSKQYVFRILEKQFSRGNFNKQVSGKISLTCWPPLLPQRVAIFRVAPLYIDVRKKVFIPIDKHSTVETFTIPQPIVIIGGGLMHRQPLM